MEEDLRNAAEADRIFSIAEVCKEQMRIVEACEFYGQAELAGYDADRCSAARWTCLMLAGNWEGAWRESDAIERRGRPDRNRFWNGREWSGEDVLIRCLHGLGDTLQFIRYVPEIRTTARSVTIEAQPKLKMLLQETGMADSVITWGEAEPDWQIQIEVNELPRIFRTTEATIPHSIPYLRVRSKSDRFVKSNKIKVGLVWAASSFDETRNLPVELLPSLLDAPDVQFFSLQAGEGWRDSLPEGLLKLTDMGTSIEEVARMMNELDLVVSVDTMNAHLAGALGRRTWTMLPYQCDWRWMTWREDTPWYPTMRLFRQASPGDWTGVIALVKDALVTMQQDCRPRAT